ncbi:MAG: glycoside hydrolase family 15 protein [Spirochaetaceae bacterium]|jgi:GH15 family glucan-1,4-alpha-glucosidase|nr:glycoside hydrolase family 15 protein [Spirochaetaceae bacterium]
MDNQKFKLLKEQSLRILIDNQHSSGAFIACPEFPTYKYSWFRDGVYIAYSLLISGLSEETRLFIEWGCQVILNQREKVNRLEQLLKTGETPEAAAFLGARYSLEGEEDSSDCPNFQIDGFGSWMWLVSEYDKKSGNVIDPRWKEAAELLVDYFTLVWKLPNNDCWEEFPDQIHPATLSCVAGGLKSIGQHLSGSRARELAGEIESLIRNSSREKGYYPKFFGSDLVDASLIWLAVPYDIIELDDPAMVKTIEEIEKNLLVEGGVKRYSEDTYYGGGRWILLSAFLGWYYIRAGRFEEAAILREWIATQSLKDGKLPEQVSEQVNDPSMIQPWVERWGSVATPLLWSHAMFLILHEELENATKRSTII